MQKRPLKIFLDDVRIPSEIYGAGADEEWVLVGTVEEVQNLLINEEVSHLSLDNDLGLSEPEGHTMIPWMMNHMKWPTEELYVHSANPYWRQAMAQDIKRYFYGCIKPQRERELREAESEAE